MLQRYKKYANISQKLRIFLGYLYKIGVRRTSSNGKLDSKTCVVVFGICEQVKRAMMRSKYVADKQKPETLALGLGREERREKVCGY